MPEERGGLALLRALMSGGHSNEAVWKQGSHCPYIFQQLLMLNGGKLTSSATLCAEWYSITRNVYYICSFICLLMDI